MENEATYILRTYPGAATWTRREDGLYDCRFGALGGSGKRIDTAENIAELLLRVHANDICVAVHDLLLLGWSDVVENILRLAQENREVSYQKSQVYERLKNFKNSL